MLKCNYRCSMLSTDFSTNCALNFIHNTDILITLGNMSAKNKGLERTIAYNNIESRFPKPWFLYQLCFEVEYTVISSQDTYSDSF